MANRATGNVSFHKVLGVLLAVALLAPGVARGLDTERISLDTSGDNANDDSAFETAFSTDGRYVVFQSDATDLVAGDTNEDSDIFLRGCRYWQFIGIGKQLVDATFEN